MTDRSRSGRLREMRIPKAIKAVQNRIRRNPFRKQKILSLKMNVSAVSISGVIKDDLRLRAYKRHIRLLLTEALKPNSKLKARALLCRYGKSGHRRILFTDEKIFTIEESFNKQNDRVYVRSSQQAYELSREFKKDTIRLL